MKKNYLAHFLKKVLLFLIIFLAISIDSCKKDIVQQNTSINTTYVNPLLNLTEKQKVQQTEIIAYLKKCKDDLTPYLQFNKTQQNVINGKHVIRIPIADDAALFFTKDNDTLKAFIYKWIDKKPGERNFTGGIFSYSFQDNKGRVLKYDNGKLEKWGIITPPVGTASQFVSGIKGSKLKVHLGEEDTFLNKIFCWVRGGNWVGYATGCDTQNGWGARIVNYVIRLVGVNGEDSGDELLDGGGGGSSYTYDNGSNFQGYTGFIVGTGPFGGTGSTGSSGSTGGTTGGGTTTGGSGVPAYGGGPIYVTKWVPDNDNNNEGGCNVSPSENGPSGDPNGGGGPSCSGGSSGHWVTYQIDPDVYFEPQAGDVYTDPESNLTYHYEDILDALESNPDVVDQLDAGDYDQVTGPPILLPLFGLQTMQNASRNFVVLKLQHPNWSNAKLWAIASYDAFKGIIHVSLDLVGLIPVVGEPADFINGGIYFIEGEKINCALSVASALPVVGWFATGGKWVKRSVAALPLVEAAGKVAYRAVKVGKDIKFVKVAINVFDHASLLALNAVKPADKTLTNISSYLVEHYGMRVKPTEQALTNIVDDIVNFGDAAGTKTEQLADLVFQREGYVKYDAKIGSNNGFDGVYIKGDPANPTDIIINEAKQFKSTGNIKLAGATPSKAAQMSDTWVDQTILEMRTSNNLSVKTLGDNLFNNQNIINKTVTSVDKTTGEIVVVKLTKY